MNSLMSLIPIRGLFAVNLIIGLVLMYQLAIVKEVDPGQFPWMMNFMIFAAACWMMVVLVEKQSHPYQRIGGYIGSLIILLLAGGYLLTQFI